jgi:hypothetical protein
MRFAASFVAARQPASEISAQPRTGIESSFFVMASTSPDAPRS